MDYNYVNFSTEQLFYLHSTSHDFREQKYGEFLLWKFNHYKLSHFLFVISTCSDKWNVLLVEDIVDYNILFETSYNSQSIIYYLR